DYLEAELGNCEWFAGDAFSGADVQLSFILEAAASRGGLDASRPRLMAFLARIRARPAYQQALARGGPYSI
ncbi:MAG: glutathione S-transferase, partial [Burkholderiales bacterium]